MNCLFTNLTVLFLETLIRNPKSKLILDLLIFVISLEAIFYQIETELCNKAILGMPPLRPFSTSTVS